MTQIIKPTEFNAKNLTGSNPIKKGDKLSVNNIKCLRSGEYKSGLEPLYFDLINEHFFAKQDIDKFEPINWKNISTES